MQKRIAHEEALFYVELLQKEIIEDREAHGKKPLKEKNDKDDGNNDNTPSSGGAPKEFTDDIPRDTKTIKCSTMDPESRWFRKEEHKNVFAYAIETACDKNLYAQRKETIERLFGAAKENHGFRYTQMYGKARMEIKIGLTFAHMNLKKLAKIKAKWGLQEERKTHKISILNTIRLIKKWL